MISKEFSSWNRFPVPPSHPSHVRCFSRRSWEDLLDPSRNATTAHELDHLEQIWHISRSWQTSILDRGAAALSHGLSTGGRMGIRRGWGEWKNLNFQLIQSWIMEREGNQDPDATLIFWVFEQEWSTEYSALGRVHRNIND